MRVLQKLPPAGRLKFYLSKNFLYIEALHAAIRNEATDKGHVKTAAYHLW